MSESLRDLASHVEKLEDSATAAFEANRAKLESRRREIDTNVQEKADEVEAAVEGAAVRGRTWWQDVKASIARPFDELRTRHEQRRAELEVDRATRVADDAEQDAIAALNLAELSLNFAEYAVIDATLARMMAEDLAAASASTVGVAS
jgi:hypothetical protein